MSGGGLFTASNETAGQPSRAVYENIASGRKTPVLFATAGDGHHEVKLCEAVLKSSRVTGWGDVHFNRESKFRRADFRVQRGDQSGRLLV